MTKVGSFLGVCLAIGFTVIAALMNWEYGLSLGRSRYDQRLFAAVGRTADVESELGGGGALQVERCGDFQAVAGDVPVTAYVHSYGPIADFIARYELAAACYRRANAMDAAEESASNAKRMREETTLDFRARRVRLERVLLVSDFEVAAQDVAVLRALTEGQQGEYTRWLASVTQDIKNQKVEKSQ